VAWVGLAPLAALETALLWQVGTLLRRHACQQCVVFDRIEKVPVGYEVSERTRAIRMTELAYAPGGYLAAGSAEVVLVSAPEVIDHVYMSTNKAVRVLFGRHDRAPRYGVGCRVDSLHCLYGRGRLLCLESAQVVRSDILVVEGRKIVDARRVESYVQRQRQCQCERTRQPTAPSPSWT
jgi:hypothetical protein